MKYGETEKNLTIYVNEPAECKWDFKDIEYSNMAYSFSCDTAKTELGKIKPIMKGEEFDNNLFQKGADQSALNNLLKDTSNALFNQAISGKYLVGSTIKPLIASAALQENIISPTKKINDNLGYISIPNSSDPSAPPTIKRDWAIHGPTDMRKAIAVSSNIYFYTVGGGYQDQQGLGPTKIKQYLSLFGWDDKTGIDLPGETDGFIPTPTWKQNAKKQPWTDGDTYNISIGQGDILVTPLQVVSSFSAIANGGILYKPQIVKENLFLLTGESPYLSPF